MSSELSGFASMFKVLPTKVVEGKLYQSTDTVGRIIAEYGLEVNGHKLAHYRTRKEYAGIGPITVKFGARVYYPDKELREWCEKVKRDGLGTNKPGKASKNYGTGSSKERKRSSRAPSLSYLKRQIELAQSNLLVTLDDL